ncbi:MAG: hypothetical protein ABWX62_00580, partial [Microterricola sp.]
WRVQQIGDGGLRWVSPAGRMYDTYPAPPSPRKPQPDQPPAAPPLVDPLRLVEPLPLVEPVETTTNIPDTPPF